MQQWRWSVFYADLDPAVGSEQAGRRPVVVVSEEDYNQIMPLVTIVPVTSRKRGRRIHPDEVLVPKTTAGLPQESIILVHQIRTISKRRLVEKVGVLGDVGYRGRVVEALRTHLDLGQPVRLEGPT